MTTWMLSLLGGVLIGLSATLLMWLNGRIAGISGIVHGLVSEPHNDSLWRIAFLLGLMIAGGVTMRLGDLGTHSRQDFPVLTLVIAGLLVGVGTRMGGGCTSGHGVCGLGRLSLRSLAAVVTFVATAMATVFIFRHVFGVLP
jgi:uncharacterized membrane protein YedE/YeeE